MSAETENYDQLAQAVEKERTRDARKAESRMLNDIVRERDERERRMLAAAESIAASLDVVWAIAEQLTRIGDALESIAKSFRVSETRVEELERGYQEEPSSGSEPAR